MSVPTFAEATPKQLARIAAIEIQVKAMFDGTTGLYEELDALRQAGLEIREAAEAVSSLSDDALDELRTLRVSRGIPAFSDWWFDRVLGLRKIVDEVDPGSDQDDEAWRQKYRAALAVDEAIAKADPDLTRLLDRAADRPLGPVDASKLEAAIGMTEAELADRAEATITALIESGWRPADII